MIGIVSHDDDVHASVVRAELDRLGAHHRLLDTSSVPDSSTLTMTFASEGEERRISWARSDAATDDADLTRIGAVWWRRPQPFEVSTQITRARDRMFAAGECDAFIAGMWACLDAEWVNAPDADTAASRKPWQLRVAAAGGLRIPRTCMTNDPDVAREFAAALRSDGHDVVFKPFSGTPETWRETRLLSPGDERGLDAVRLAPVIFQEAIPGGRDVRVTIVGDELFAAEIRPTGDAATWDFRIDPEAPIMPHELPGSIRERLMALMRRLGLRYGAVDLRVDPDGDYVFLEVNPAGQWLFIELMTGQPISAALARLLYDLDEQQGPRRRTGFIPSAMRQPS